MSARKGAHATRRAGGHAGKVERATAKCSANEARDRRRMAREALREERERRALIGDAAYDAMMKLAAQPMPFEVFPPYKDIDSVARQYFRGTAASELRGVDSVAKVPERYKILDARCCNPYCGRPFSTALTPGYTMPATGAVWCNYCVETNIECKRCGQTTVFDDTAYGVCMTCYARLECDHCGATYAYDDAGVDNLQHLCAKCAA